jgi:thiamine-phosphate pyrophosphorylase
MDKLIVVTHPGHLNDEIDICKDLLNAGLQRLHVRKYKWSPDKIEEWLNHFSHEQLKKISVHHQLDIFEKLHLGGLHLPYKNDFSFSKRTDQTFSCSVHTWDEAKNAMEHCDYVFISPVFDSISKFAYQQNPELLPVPAELKSKKVFALGGIDDTNISEIHRMGYYGAVVLGYIWNNPDEALNNFKNLRKADQNV